MRFRPQRHNLESRQIAAALQAGRAQVPVNACGDTLGFDGLLSPAFGNVCVNG
ncbi:chaplin [Streptomyces shenzhenensis]|uniref:chaplin n=1 Tax=Streptomyces shenzhenensis TaxID=943815 RepID=UPI001F47763E|nr:chaplin [Streptomyces shenzhenensis]